MLPSLGSFALRGTWDGTVVFWFPDRSVQESRFTGHTDWVNAIAIDEDQGVVYSASEDQTVRAWDLATGEPRGVTYGVSPFRSLAAVQGGVYAGDEAGNLWPRSLDTCLRLRASAPKRHAIALFHGASRVFPDASTVFRDVIEL